MADFLKLYNLSILAIPAYYILAVAPHTYALGLCTTNNPKTWNNANPRGKSNKDAIVSDLSPEQYGRFERAEAAHANAMENLPIFATAIVLANTAGLKRAGLDGIDGFVGMWFAVRIAHTISYIGIEDRRLSYVRSGLWVVSLGLCFRMFGKAAKVLNGNLA
ncbi:hypothetical protein EJ08DRAFT_313377 [Tothia fuscella]|uniref:Uncharacterized protein n=1 Tax=Tothia fuscella TaxID=1048955 RepID=A0A9P4NNQ0_9PEZI|nr:hypothetical protein EJ08DRAFT_313377 [Tothia fuscella]